ncbi:hypothetical protein GSI_02677 [Ganoderma sinense ZZ0214-1]|uniref:DUF6534 domain-containing protein n=1 Tax=Ganoderma sinense ZZ0214-1 TaxID=1077348 RepID=A0A2G8SMA9_9APHY|nr:hypothetical protein GSI_02677 [Ganoderma sinense ZZ0214-1]
MAQSALPPAVLSGFKEAMGCLVIGTVLSACIYGVSVLQAYLYFPNSRRDSTSMRSFVALLFTLDTVSMFLTVVTLYDFVVTDFGDPLLLFSVPPSLAVLNAFTVLISTSSQCFFARRLWLLSNGNKLLVGTIVLGALGDFGLGVAISVYMYYHREIAALSSLEIRILGGIESGMSVICDVAIVIGLCYYLNSKRTGFKRTDSIIDRLIIYAINRGVLTAVCQAGHMISVVGLPSHFTSIAFGLIESKLYCNTLFATLNARKSLREDGDNVVELVAQIVDHIIPPVPFGGERGMSPAGRVKLPDIPCSKSDTESSFVLDISSNNLKKLHSDV